ncbi:uncharacterized protein LOC110707579 [Chenopodium quinoa]|uniref:uncharacterized protein LOC110707579 n=1 Tax=Chenopodium quinoa TaxID=63459 RepID=UPI000B797BB4|nr:uncharacterized protein LOC110707579 [Chenopodium quinoa]
MVVEVPIMNANEDKLEYVRVFNSAAADESFPRDSQPEPSQNEPTQPQPSQNEPSAPKKSPRRKKVTPPPPPPQPNSAASSSAGKPKEQTRLKQKEWRVPRSTANKYGLEVGKNKRGGREGSTRRKRPVTVEESDGESDACPSDDSEDDDYEVSEAKDDLDMELNLDDQYIVEEEDLADNIPEKTFEDYLDGSHVLYKMYKNGKVWSNLPFGSIQLEPWLIFENKQQFHEVFRDFCIQEGFVVIVGYADNYRYTAKCMINDCNWRIHAAVLVDKVSWEIKKLEGEHTTCGRLEENPMVSSTWLCRHLMQDLKANPEIPVDSLQRMCLEREQIHGGFAQSYALFPKYAKMIKATNPGSYALITWTDSGINGEKFKACFISFAAQLQLDDNNEIFVIAYGLVDTESIESWTYFFRNLRILFSQYGSERDDWTFISDKMKGVESALFEVFSRATRRVCCHHVYSNCKTAGWSGTEFHKLFWIAANAYNSYVYDKAMSKIKKYDAKAFQNLTDIEE